MQLATAMALFGSGGFQPFLRFWLTGGRVLAQLGHKREVSTLLEILELLDPYRCPRSPRE